MKRQPIIALTDRHDERVNALLLRIPIMTAAMLFGGDRWMVVERVALALDDAHTPVGLATLAPTDEVGAHGPHIIGVWVQSHLRRCGIGRQLVLALIAESLARYNTHPTIVATTLAGLALARRVQATDSRLVVVDASCAGFLLH